MTPEERPQIRIEDLTREQLEKIVSHQERTIDVIIDVNNGLQKRLGETDEKTADVLREWSKAINEVVDVSTVEIVKVLLGNTDTQPN